MSMVNLDKPVNSLTKEDCLFILKEHISAFGCTLAEYYSCRDGDLLIDVLNRLDEITEEIQPRILYVLTKKAPTNNYLTEIVQPHLTELNVDDYEVDAKSDMFYVKLDDKDINDLVDSYTVIISDAFIQSSTTGGGEFTELFVDDGNTKTYKERVTNALTGLREFFCTKVTLYP